jgi:hypothetical protein
MFTQVITGSVADADKLTAAVERWARDLGPGADGWLGTTAGITADGKFAGLARFSSPQAAQRNSERPEQHQWWQDTAKLFGGDIAFHDCRYSIGLLRGGSDSAGFVQVKQGRTRETEQLVELARKAEGLLRDHRPEIIGGTIALHGDGGYTEAIYFTSEAEARTGERAAPPELEPLFAEMRLITDDVRYFDLTMPLLYSP